MRFKAVLASSSLIIFLSLGAFGCSSGSGTAATSAEDPAPIPGPDISAEFSADPTTGNAPHEVQFTDESDVEGPGVSYLWVFGDGGTSTLQSPVHTYELPGTYTTSLLITTADAIDTETKADFIEVLPAGPEPEPEFSADATIGVVRFAVQFTNETDLHGAPVVKFLWEFGDGTTSAEESPRHVYLVAGVYTVTLSVTTAGGTVAVSKEDFILVQDPVSGPTADFTYTPKKGDVPLTVNFTNLSDLNGAESADYFWDFGDGATSTLKDPMHTYTARGRYSVSLFVTTRGGSDLDFRFEAVIATVPPDPIGATDFVLTFEEGFTPSDIVLSLFISSESEASGQVNMPGQGFLESFSVSPGTATEVIIPIDALVEGSDVIKASGIQVTADNPVTVYGLHQEDFTTDGFVAFPVSGLGTDHYVMSMNALTGPSQGLDSQFAVVATDNNTTLTITPTVDTGSRTAGTPFQITLNRLDVYQLQTDDVNEDLTGTHIESDKAVAVFGGHVCANVPDNDTAACDHLIDQLPPVNTWSTEVITVPLETRLNGDTFRILASVDDTNVTIEGSSPETFVLNRGEFQQRILEGINLISADNPILVAQFSNGQQFDDQNADPFMMVLVPVERFLRGYVISTPTSTFSGDNFVNIVALTVDANRGDVKIDGVAVSAGLFQEVPGTDFSAAGVEVTVGTHRIVAPDPIGLYVYGFEDFDSYGWPGGMAF